VQYENEGRFIQEIEAQLPSGAMVFQLPYLAFPEVNPPGKMVDYDPLRGVLYSRSLRWSYGAWKKSPADQWQAYVSSLPLDKMVRTLVLVGFQGIYLDRFGYEDGGKELEIRLKNLSDTSPLVSSDNRFLFFNLRSYVEKLRNNYTAQEWEQQCQQAWWSPVNLSWGLGFSYEEKDAEFRWRWCCKPTTELIVANHSPETRSFVMKMRFAGLDSPPAQLIIDGPQIQAVESLPLEPGPELVSRLTLPQGKHVIRLKTSARGHRPPNDSRTLYFRLVNFELTELDEQGRVVSISR
jgi:phosphoglycerol transferase